MWPRMWWVCVVVGVVWWQTEVVSGQLDETKYRYASTLEYTILNTTDVYDVNNRCRCRRKCLEVEQCVGISIPRDPDNFQCKALVDANPGSVFINDSPDHDSFVKIYYMSSVTTTTTNAPSTVTRPPGVLCTAISCTVRSHQVYCARPPGVLCMAISCTVRSHQVYCARPPGVLCTAIRCLCTAIRCTVRPWVYCAATGVLCTAIRCTVHGHQMCCVWPPGLLSTRCTVHGHQMYCTVTWFYWHGHQLHSAGHQVYCARPSGVLCTAIRCTVRPPDIRAWPRFTVHGLGVLCTDTSVLCAVTWFTGTAIRCTVHGHQVYCAGHQMYRTATRCNVHGHQVYCARPPCVLCTVTWFIAWPSGLLCTAIRFDARPSVYCARPPDVLCTATRFTVHGHQMYCADHQMYCARPPGLQCTAIRCTVHGRRCTRPLRHQVYCAATRFTVHGHQMYCVLATRCTVHATRFTVHGLRCTVHLHQMYCARPPGLRCTAIRCTVYGHQMYCARPPGLRCTAIRCTVHLHQMYCARPPGLLCTHSPMPSIVLTRPKQTFSAAVGPVLLPAGGRDDAEWKCRKQGQTLAVLRTQQDLVNFLQQVPDTSGTYVHLALQYKRSHAFWTPRDEPFSTTELGQKPLPFDLDGKDFVLSSYSLAGKTIESGVWQGYNYASGHCSNQNQELAVYKTEAEYQKLLTEAMPSKEDNFLALKYNSDNMRLEWDEPNIPIKVTPLAHLADLPITGNSGDCLYPKVNKTNPAAPFIASFTRDSCSEDGQAVCMDVPKIAEPGQVYKYEVRRTVVDHYSWFRPRREGYQLAILKTREQVDQVFNQISSDSPTLVNAVDDFLVALRWDSEAQELLWEDDTPYSSTPLASHSSTTDEPQDNKNHYLLHQKDGVYKGFRGKDNYDDTEYQLWMKLVP
ncbi:hypothetical protein Hamer_G022414 [Homarus americanus]|uniref:Uncharacterized protein n=1 Tax=Homarus americanus TaxID=6706 RepID=A0A8J5MQC1_HOMAM|nr:hypothetical protein Hamer_G022414 [Homarus americanus]